MTKKTLKPDQPTTKKVMHELYRQRREEIVKLTSLSAKMSELPKKCYVCNKDCGGEDMPAAWVIYDDDNSTYWVCEKCHQRIINDQIYQERL